MSQEWKAWVGVGERQNRHHVHKGTTRTTAVVADDGPLRGSPVGAQRDHWDDRRDAKVTGRTVTVNTELLRARKDSA